MQSRDAADGAARATLSGEKRDEMQRGWPVLLAATLGSAAGLSSVPFYSLGSFIEPLQAEFDWGRADVASAFLYTTITLALIAPLLGLIIDRLGSRIVALVSIPLLALILFQISRFDGPLWQFHGLYGLAALAGAGTTPINYTRAVNSRFHHMRGLALGISQAGIAVAAITLPLLLAMIHEGASWRTGYAVLALLVLLPWPFVLLGMGDRKAQSAMASQPGTTSKQATAPLPPRRQIFANPAFWLLGVPFMLASTGIAALVVHMVPLLRDAGLSLAAAGSMASIIGFGVLAGRLVTGWLIDRFFAPHVAVILFASTICGCLLLFTGQTMLVPLAAAFIGLSLGAEADIIAYLTARYFGMARYAFVYGFIYSMFAIGAAVGPAIAGRLYDASGSYDSSMWAVIAVLAVAMAGILRLPRFRADTTGETI